MASQEILEGINTNYKYGFVTDIESDRPEKGLNEKTSHSFDCPWIDASIFWTSTSNKWTSTSNK